MLQQQEFVFTIRYGVSIVDVEKSSAYEEIELYVCKLFNSKTKRYYDYEWLDK